MVERNEFPILVVDDDESLLKMIMDVLRHAGFKRLAKAGGASEAMAVLASLDRPLHDTKTAVLNEPGIIVLDVMLPDRSGFEFCKELKDARPDSVRMCRRRGMSGRHGRPARAPLRLVRLSL